MARITVEDCLGNIDNIFEMVLVASKRARRIAHGADAMVELENDKPTVIALREIAEGHITPAILEEVEQPAARGVSCSPRQSKKLCPCEASPSATDGQRTPPANRPKIQSVLVSFSGLR